jgi:hypothetical protein
MTEGKRHPCYLISLVVMLFLLSLGCQSGPPPVMEPCPGWVKSIPRDDAYFYARGISGPTPRAVDAWDQAIKRARARLAQTIITHITVKDTIISSSRGEYVEEIVKVLSDTELNYTEVIEMWFDRYGVCGHEKHVYVLVGMEKKNAALILKTIQ